MEANPVPRFYRGGAMISRFRGIHDGESAPEDWVASMTEARGEGPLGLARLPDGRSLAEVAKTEGLPLFGPDHLDRFGVSPALLVKLLDAGQRLPVHLHPDRAFARSHLDCDFGKTEAWVVLGTTGADPCVYLGFSTLPDADRVREWVESQDRVALVGSLNRVPVKSGDAILVPAGTPHSIGEGVFVAELQEPTDMSILLEWNHFVPTADQSAHLGLGWELALQALDYRQIGPSGLDQLRGPGTLRGGRVLPEIADPFFRAEVLGAGSEASDAGFSVLVAIGGDGELAWQTGSQKVRAGQTLLYPFDAGAMTVTGDLRLLRCRPPAPDAPQLDRPVLV